MCNCAPIQFIAAHLPQFVIFFSSENWDIRSGKEHLIFPKGARSVGESGHRERNPIKEKLWS